MFRDRNILWKRRKRQINLVDFSSVIGTNGVDIVLAAGVSVFQNISTFNLAGVLFDTDLDAMTHYMVVPYDMDARKEIGFRVLWTSGSSDTGDTLKWDVKCDLLAEGATLIEATTVLDTAIDLDTTVSPTGTAYQSQWSGRGIKNGNALTQAQVDAGALMAVTVILTDLVDIGEDIFALALEFDYAVRACK